MTASQPLLLAIDLLFAAGALASLGAMAATWLAVRGRIGELRAEFARSDAETFRTVEYRYTIISHRLHQMAGQVVPLPVRQPALRWSDLRPDFAVAA